jgi:hypothetical protein
MRQSRVEAGVGESGDTVPDTQRRPPRVTLDYFIDVTCATS